MSLRFLHMADTHLDAQVGASKLRLPEAKRAERDHEIRTVFSDACEIAKREGCDVILLAGDLVDDESVKTDTFRFMVDTFEKIAPLPVVIAPGNHDPFSLSSFYSSEALFEGTGKKWPDHVHIFTDSTFQSFSLNDSTRITGLSHLRNRSISDRLLSRAPKAGNAMYELLIFHGSREGFAPPGKKTTLPFSDEELLGLGYHYAALGHYHTYSEIRDNSDSIRAAYPGTPVSQRLYEDGTKGVILGEISETGEMSLRRENLDPRTLHRIEVDVSPFEHSTAIRQGTEQAIKESGARKQDILYIHYQGHLREGADLPDIYEEIEKDYFHVRVDREDVRPPYNLDRYRKGPTTDFVSLYVQKLSQQMDESSPPQKKKIIENAIYYGLDALIRGKIESRYENTQF